MKSAWLAWASWAATCCSTWRTTDYSVAGYDKDASKVAALRKEAENRDIRGAESVSEFVACSACRAR